MISNSESKTNKPTSVNIAVYLMLISFFLLGPIIVFLDRDALSVIFSSNQSMLPEGFAIAIAVSVAVVMLGFYSWLIYKISKGRNWARIVLLVLFILGIYPFINEIAETYHLSVLVGSVKTLQALFQLIALCLLFFGQGASYFRASKFQNEVSHVSK